MKANANVVVEQVKRTAFNICVEYEHLKQGLKTWRSYF